MVSRWLRPFSGAEPEDLSRLYTDPPKRVSDQYPEVPRPDEELNPLLLASRWLSHALRCEDVPAVAIELLEEGNDTPAMRRLAGETRVACAADIEPLVAAMFCELGVAYPFSERCARTIAIRQIAREVIAGHRNPWAAASYLEIAMWDPEMRSLHLDAIFLINDEIDWEVAYRRPIKAMESSLYEEFARLAMVDIVT